MATSNTPPTPTANTKKTPQSTQQPQKIATPAPPIIATPTAPVTATTSATTSNRPNGGYCCAGCTNPATPIQENRSSLYYLLDLSGKLPVVIEIFQYHSHEYSPKYTTTLNPHPAQCDTKFHQTFVPGSNVHSLITGKPHNVGFLTGDTLHLLDIIEKCYTISPQAANTIQTIRNLTLKHASYVQPVYPIGLIISTPKVCYDLYRFVEDYKYNVKHKLSTSITVDSHSDTQYEIHFGQLPLNPPLAKTPGYIIPTQLIDIPKFKILTAQKLVRIINKVKIIP